MSFMKLEAWKVQRSTLSTFKAKSTATGTLIGTEQVLSTDY